MRHFAKQLFLIGSLFTPGLVACDDGSTTDVDAGAADAHAEHAAHGGEHAGPGEAGAEPADPTDAGAADAESDASHPGQGQVGDDDFKGCPEGIPDFDGLSAVGEEKVFAVRVTEAMPAEPERYINNWTVEITTADGEPVDDVQIDRARTFMPIHGHDGNVQSVITPLDEPGEFDVEKLNFTMRGPWEVQLWLYSESLGEDYVVLDVCVAK